MINISNKQLTYIPDSICRFKQLKVLYCHRNFLRAIPPLPSSLRELYCSNNQIRELPELPEGLIRLSCGQNEISFFPRLPRHLRILYCDGNRFTLLPPLPPDLVFLDCSHNQLDHLFPIYTLEHRLPHRMYFLRCNNNRLTTISKLSTKMESLYCSENRLTELPRISKTGIKTIHCFRNCLSSLPLLPPSLNTLLFSENEIYNVVQHNKLYIIKRRVALLYKLKAWAYAQQCKRALRYILWVKIREPQIRDLFHPSKLIQYLEDEGEDEDENFSNRSRSLVDIVDQWINV
jgi:Leucine-rich repeat (LRR) protein